MSEEGMPAQLLFQTLERIERGVEKLDSDIKDVKSRLAEGDSEMKMTRLRLDRVEREQDNLRTRIDEAKQEEQRQTVELARARSKRTWDIAKGVILLLLGMAGALIWSGAKAELKSDLHPARTEEQRGR